MKFLDSPVVNQWVQSRLEVAEPEEPGADLKEVVLVIEVVVKRCHKAVGSEGGPADDKDNKENQDGGEGTGLKAHIDAHLEGSLQTHEAQLAGLTEAYALRIAMNSDCIVPHSIEDAHKRIQHHQERNEERNEGHYDDIGLVTRAGGVAKHTLGSSGRDLQLWAAHSQRERHTKGGGPRNSDEHLGAVWIQLILPLNDN